MGDGGGVTLGVGVGVGGGATLGVGTGDAGGATLALGDAFALEPALGVGPGDEEEGDVLCLAVGSGFDVPL